MKIAAASPTWPARYQQTRPVQLARIARALARVEARAERCNEALTALAHRRADLLDQRARLVQGGGR